MEAAWLDLLFRLVREDMVGPLRTELSDLGVIGQLQPAEEEGDGGAETVAKTIGSVPGKLLRNVFHPVSVCGVELKPRPCVLVGELNYTLLHIRIPITLSTAHLHPFFVRIPALLITPVNVGILPNHEGAGATHRCPSAFHPGTRLKG